jgi:subtilase family serine protease
MGTFSERFQGLGPGQSVKRFYATDCTNGDRTVVADADKEVKESDETNNSKFGSFLC